MVPRCVGLSICNRMINFHAYVFSKFSKLPESRSDKSNLRKNTRPRKQNKQTIHQFRSVQNRQNEKS